MHHKDLDVAALPLDQSSFLDQTIQIATLHFKKSASHYAKATKINDTSFISDINAIPDSRLFAARGPRNDDDLINLFQDSAFRQPSIRYIVALGNRLSEVSPSAEKCDFINYFIGEGERRLPPYRIAIKHIDGSHRVCPHKQRSKPNFFIESELCIQKKTLTQTINVIGLELPDGKSFDLSDDPGNIKKEVFWKLYQLSLDHAVLVHCKHGRGRTGHLIFILELLKHYPTIIANPDPEIAASRILDIFHRIRSQRPRLIHFKKQFTEAIRLVGEQLYPYGLAQGYVKETKAIPLPSEPVIRAHSSQRLFHHRSNEVSKVSDSPKMRRI